MAHMYVVNKWMVLGGTVIFLIFANPHPYIVTPVSIMITGATTYLVNVYYRISLKEDNS